MVERNPILNPPNVSFDLWYTKVVESDHLTSVIGQPHVYVAHSLVDLLDSVAEFWIQSIAGLRHILPGSDTHG